MHNFVRRSSDRGELLYSDGGGLEGVNSSLTLMRHASCLSLRFMAPEVLACQVGPASDVWSAGIMAHQLLTGRFPFDDKRCPSYPAVTAVW